MTDATEVSEMGYALVVTAVVGLATGFVGGFVTFKRSHAWCRECGASLRCLECASQLDWHATSSTDRPRVQCGMPGPTRLIPGPAERARKD